MPSRISRRAFVQSGAASAALGLLSAAAAGTPRPARRPRVAVLLEPGFPAVDTAPPRRDDLAAALDGLDLTFLGVGGLDGLSPGRYDVYLSPYGSAFPKEQWPALLAYLDAGGNWVNLGGVPCAVAAVRDHDRWRVEERGAEYHHRLGVTLACAVATSGVAEWRASVALPWASRLAAHLAADTVWALYYRLSSVADTPDESGSAGPMEAVVRPLVSGLDAAGRPIAAPLVMLDRLEREFAGGRWIFAALDGPVAPATLRTLVEVAGTGSRRFEARPSLACYRVGERASVSLSYRAAARAGSEALVAPCRVTVFDDAGRRVAAVGAELRGDRSGAAATIDLSGAMPEPPRPGLYRVEATLTLPGEESPEAELGHTTGFWVWDADLLAGGAPLGAGAFSLTRSGEPFAVTGTTYMASDVHRKFLLQPNPWLWHRDFAAMKRVGVNLVRTGIWTGWRTLMPRPGAFDEAALRALDAWLLTARRHDVPVIFTLFAFLPETWGGENPYLDPRALDAQRAFVTSIARRYTAMRDLLWDLINEPSFCNKDHLWSCRPNYDRFEREAWSTWLRARHPEPDVAAAALPRLEDFAEPAGAGDADSRVVVEYRLFAQAMFARWVREIRAALSGAGAARQLVTVGQDEAGTRDSPNNLFLAPELDFTCVHNWWLNDALLWDGVMTRAPGKANLVEETGVMFSGRPAGVDERWETYARDLLERKMALSVGPAGAGFVEWVWNSNCYMPSDNEAAIGLLRADGTAKPELEALRGVAAFVADAGRHMVGRTEDPVLLVVPHANMFSTRNTATDATKRAVRAMAYGCRVGLAAVSEYGVTPGMDVPPLVLVPAPRVLRRAAWEALLAWAARGSTVLVTGAVDCDEEGRRVDRLAPLGIAADARPEGTDPAIRTRVGRGALLWSPEAVEAAADLDRVVALYRWALGQVRITPPVEVEGADAGTLVHTATYRDAALYTVVADASPARVRLRHASTTNSFDIAVPAGRAAMAMVRLRDGRILARYPPA